MKKKKAFLKQLIKQKGIFLEKHIAERFFYSKFGQIKHLNDNKNLDGAKGQWPSVRSDRGAVLPLCPLWLGISINSLFRVCFVAQVVCTSYYQDPRVKCGTVLTEMWCYPQQSCSCQINK